MYLRVSLLFGCLNTYERHVCACHGVINYLRTYFGGMYLFSLVVAVSLRREM